MSAQEVMMAKSNLRKQLNSIINNLPEREIIRQSKIVTDKITANEVFRKAKVVSIYLSMKKEIQTEDLLRHIFKEGKECFIPRFHVGNPEMEMICLSSMEQYNDLPRNKWDIKQPPDGEQIKSVFKRGKLDLVLAPGLGFTREGLRLGRGKGYYDRFLAKCKRDLPCFPYTIGLAFTEQVVPEIPTDQMQENCFSKLELVYLQYDIDCLYSCLPLKALSPQASARWPFMKIWTNWRYVQYV